MTLVAGNHCPVELGEQSSLDARIVDLKELIRASKNYDVEFVKGFIGNNYREEYVYVQQNNKWF